MVPLCVVVEAAFRTDSCNPIFSTMAGVVVIEFVASKAGGKLDVFFLFYLVVCDAHVLGHLLLWQHQEKRK